MSVLLFENDFSTTFASGITNVATTATLLSATGLPTIVGDQYYKLTFIDTATGLIKEIVDVTARAGNVITMTRGAEGTTAVSWSAGDKISMQWTAGCAEAMQQTAQAQGQAANYAAGAGTNAITATFSPAVSSHVVGMPLRVKIANTNSGAVTFNPGPSVVNVIAPDGSALQAGDLPAGEIVEFKYDGANYQVQVVGGNATRPGVLELATSAETITGTDTARSVTPAGLAAALAALVSSVPVGVMADYPGSTPPAGFLECNGASLSTTTYAALFAVCGYTYGGIGANFNLPDLRGYFKRGWSHGTGIDAGRAFGSSQTSANLAHTHTFPVYSSDASGGFAADGSGSSSATVTTSSSGSASESRPYNVAVLPIIKY